MGERITHAGPHVCRDCGAQLSIPAAPADFGSQVAMRGGLSKNLAARIDAIESATPAASEDVPEYHDLSPAGDILGHDHRQAASGDATPGEHMARDALIVASVTGSSQGVLSRATRQRLDDAIAAIRAESAGTLDDAYEVAFGQPLCADCHHSHTEAAWSDRDKDDGTCWNAGALVCGCPKFITPAVKRMRAARYARLTEDAE